MRGPRRHRKANRSLQSKVPLALVLGSALSGNALVASANSMTTVIGSTTSNYTMYGAQDLLFQSVGTINTTLTPALTVDSSVTHSTITLQPGAKLISSAGSGIGLLNKGQIDRISNSGLISGTQTAIENQASITLITNTGTISGANAIVNTGSLGAIANAGTIAGNISLGSSALTITGGSGSSFGTLTGGTISSSANQLTLGSGNLLLDDDLVLNSGSGTLTSSGGTLQINGHKTLSGNYVQDASETLRIGVSDGATATGATSDAGYGRLTVSGSATIASGSSITLATTGSSYSFAQGQRYLVIVANSSGTNYNASSLNYSAVGYSGTVTGAVVSDGGNSDLVLTLGSTGGGSSPINAATASNSSEALRGLFNYTGTQAQLLNLFNAAAAIGSDSGKANAVGAQLSPIGVASTNFLISNASLGATSGILNNRLGQTRTGLSSGDAMLDQSVWGQVFGSHISQGERDGLSGYRADFGGLMIGADRPIGDRWQAGAAFSYGTSSSRETGSGAGSSIKSQALGVHGYAGFTADKWYLNLDTSVRRLSYDSHRKIEFPGFYGVATGNYHGTQYQVSAETGWPILLDSKLLHRTTLTPIAGLSYSRLEQSAYTEKDGNGAALSVGATADSSLSSRLAVRLERGSDTRWGAVTSYVQLGWQHELRNTRLQTTARYVADATGGTSFTSQGAKPQRDVAVLTLGTMLAKSEQLTLSGQLQINSGDNSYREYGANLMLRYRF